MEWSIGVECSPNLDPRARIFLLVDLREIFFRFRVGGTKKKKKKKL